MQGVVCGIFTNGDPDETLFKQEMDALNDMMRTHALPNEVRHLTSHLTSRHDANRSGP